MTVQQLIDELVKHPPSAKVLTDGRDNERFDDVINVWRLVTEHQHEIVIVLDHKTL